MGTEPRLKFDSIPKSGSESDIFELCLLTKQF